jgi:hypothetical protein
MHVQHFGTAQSYTQMLLGFYIMRPYSAIHPNSSQVVHATGQLAGFSIEGMTIESKLPSLTINANTFSNVDDVKIVAADQAQPVFTSDTHFYYCDSVGLIKKEIELSPANIESWSIKRWNIVR